MVLGAMACGGGRPAARGFGSTELEPIRDPTIQLVSEYGLDILVYTTGSPPVYWTLDLATGALQSYGATMPPPPTSTGTPPPQPYTCNQNYVGDLNGSYTLQIVDTATNVETDVAGVVSYTSCPGADRMLTAIAFDANGGLVLESGPFDQLRTSALTVGVLAFVSWGGYALGSTDPGPPTNVTVLAAPVTAPDQEEIDTIDLATGDVTVDVPSVPVSAAWASGATPAGSLQSATVAGSAALIRPLDGHYIYPRKMSDGGSTMFAGPFASGPASELALFQVPAGTPLPSSSEVYAAPSGIQGPPRALMAWQLDDALGTVSNLVIWDDTDLTVTACPSVVGAFLEGVLSPDQSKVLFAVPQAPSGLFGSYGSAGLLDLLVLGGPGVAPSCQQLAGSEVAGAAFSPDSDFICWLEQPSPAGEGELFTAASDGSGARSIGKGEIEDVHFVPGGGARLELTLGGELEWMDLHDPTATLHHVAEQVYGPIYDIAGQWLIMEYQWSSTDGTGTLAVINRDDGQVRTISPSVAQYTVLSELVGADGGVVSSYDDAVGTQYVVVYVVRGRNPSPQDGIWRATITAAELQ
jgi:hypothetical protein